jgi:hypothetical protein
VISLLAHCSGQPETDGHIHRQRNSHNEFSSFGSEFIGLNTLTRDVSRFYKICMNSLALLS